MRKLIYTFVKGLIKLLFLPLFAIISLLLVTLSLIILLGGYEDESPLENFVDWFMGL